MADEQPTHWSAGRIADGEPRTPGSPWLWLSAVLTLVLAVDLTLGLGSVDLPAPATAELDRAKVRARLVAATDTAHAGRPTFVLVGDSVLAGDVMAASVPDWASQRVVDHLRAELSPTSDAVFEQVAFDGLLPIDALHVLAELDRLDPAGDVTLVLELNLRYFSDAYAERSTCTRAELCELGRTRIGGDLPRRNPGSSLERAGEGLLESVGLATDWLRRRAPITRHRSRLSSPELAELDGLVRTRASAPISRAEGLARVSAHYRDAALEGSHAQLVALAEIVERLRASGRAATLFFTPLEDEFVRATLPGNRLGGRQALITGLVHDRGLDPPGSAERPRVRVLDLDHPLFGSEYFLDHVHLDPAGNELLARNLLHELGLPLRERPSAWTLVHGEDHDRSLVHRRGVGYADGGATRALFRGPEGVAVSPTGDWIVIADTGNHVLRELRGSMAIVERLAGTQRRPGSADGPADQAQLERPRSPEILGDAVYFIDGRKRQRVRRLARDRVETLRWSGPSCAAYTELEGRGNQLHLLCADDRVLTIELDTRAATIAFDPHASEGLIAGIRRIEPTTDGRLLVADGDSRIWSIMPAKPPQLLFGNSGQALLPPSAFPHDFAEVRLHRIVGMEWVDRYGALLVQDEHDLGRDHKRLAREETERIHLRLLDFDDRRIYPWIKAIPHGDAFVMRNEVSDNLVSYHHLGAMAIVEADASLVYVERARSRVFRVADGLLAAAKAGGLRSEVAKISLPAAISTDTATQISARFRPDRFLASRHEPIPRAGPHVALIVGSTLSALSDRIGNYGLARLLELELGGELGARDGVRLDVFARMFETGTLATAADTFERFLAGEGPPPDIVMIELSALFGPGDERPSEQLDRIECLADRFDSLVIFYDNSAMLADGRDGLRARPAAIEPLIRELRVRGLLLLEPTDQLLRELLVESPWGNQPWGAGQHHGAPWAIELTAKLLSSLAYPVVREFLRGRRPAFERALAEDP